MIGNYSRHRRKTTGDFSGNLSNRTGLARTALLDYGAEPKRCHKNANSQVAPTLPDRKTPAEINSTSTNNRNWLVSEGYRKDGRKARNQDCG